MATSRYRFRSLEGMGKLAYIVALFVEVAKKQMIDGTGFENCLWTYRTEVINATKIP